MIELQGKYNTAKVYNDHVEEQAIGQIISFLNHEAFKDGNIAIMPDVHFGKGAVIGFTAPTSGKVIPNVIGVDIGCGVTAFKLGPRNHVGEDFQKLDDYIRSHIPNGFNVHEDWRELTVFDRFVDDDFKKSILEVCASTSQDGNRVLNSLGTLGGGNHFIEVNKDKDDNLWLTIHSGSRNFGLQIAQFHQGKAIEAMGKMGGLEYLEGDLADAYIHDMKVAQKYAEINRQMMGWLIYKKHYKVKDPQIVSSVHNYINFEDNIVRKGAISAHEGERVIIPLNMRDGSILGTGKGNVDWNNSAPHGAGRLMSRGEAKRTISLEKFQHSMKGIWSSCVKKSTLDESPMAYKKAEDIIGYLDPTVTVDDIIKPVYNFKA